MKLSFLCANHREWLASRPDQAIHCCANAFETGWYLYQQRRVDEALPHLGCAFDTAEIMLTTGAIGPNDALEWFLQTLTMLSQTLKELGQVDDCKQVYRGAIDRLQKEANRNAALLSPIALQINSLAHELRQLNEDDCIPAKRGYGTAQQCASSTVH